MCDFNMNTFHCWLRCECQSSYWDCIRIPYDKSYEEVKNYIDWSENAYSNLCRDAHHIQLNAKD